MPANSGGAGPLSRAGPESKSASPCPCHCAGADARRRSLRPGEGPSALHLGQQRTRRAHPWPTKHGQPLSREPGQIDLPRPAPRPAKPRSRPHAIGSGGRGPAARRAPARFASARRMPVSEPGPSRNLPRPGRSPCPLPSDFTLPFPSHQTHLSSIDQHTHLEPSPQHPQPSHPCSTPSPPPPPQ